MDKDTKIELLKILVMIVILVALIVGIVWLHNKTRMKLKEQKILVVKKW